MGATGAGKSTVRRSVLRVWLNSDPYEILQFINTLLGQQVAPVGHNLNSYTSHVQAYTYNDPQFPNNRIVMVDTPGFDDTVLSDREILRRIGVWLAQS